METPQHIFALSRKEQRVVIIILILLIGATAVRQYSSRGVRPVLAHPAKIERTIPLDEETSPPPNEH
jgi:uncharacterized membrane protein